MSAIDTTNLRKEYGDVVAVKGLDLTVESGEVFGFLGPNGAGKSTTINVLLDFVRPTSGSATVLGLDAQDQSKEVRRRIGVLPEGFDTYDRLTGRHHLEFAIDSKETDDDPMALLETVGIADDADRKAGDYSKGMAQRLLLAMALVGDPDVLVLDEPTTGLDPNGAREVREIAREQAERGTTVFFSSHILGQVEAVCDRVGILRDGELVAVDDIEGLRESTGGQDILEVSVERLSDDVVAAVERVSGVSRVRTDRSGDLPKIVVESEGSKTAILEAIETTGTEVEDFSTKEVSLEQVFQAYTTEATR